MANAKRLLSEATNHFINKDYDKALFIYGQLISQDPTNKEYKLYAIFCDIASEDEQKAISLFDYFAISKDEDFDAAVKYVEDVIDAYDGDIEKMMDMLKDISDSTVDSLDAIKYEDFKELVKTRGSFRIAFEDIMFSTKVAIESKEDFFDFVLSLIENDFNTTAYSYLDGFNEYFSYDTKLEELYKKLEEKKLGHNHK